MVKILNPAPPWRAPRSEFATLYHGTTAIDAQAILNTGVDLSHSKPNSDFGRGFYTTSLRPQAGHWAWIKYYKLPAIGRAKNQPAVLWIHVPRVRLARLESLHYVLGDYDCEDFWSLVQHCRRSSVKKPRDHKKPGWYDVVSGPVAAMWKQRAIVAAADQFSFHTAAAVGMLNAIVQAKSDAGWTHVR